ncbi:MAG: hypothetical protein Q9205_001065 [Flavoplaca limonia]
MGPVARRSTRISADTSRLTSTAVKRLATPPTDGERPHHKRAKKASDVKRKPSPNTEIDRGTDGKANDSRLAATKWRSWSAHATSSPYPDFGHPTRLECETAHRVLIKMHGEAVKAEFEDPNTPETIPFVLDAMVVAILSQATSWSNAKRAMDSMKKIYGSIFAYDEIASGGQEKLQDTLRCGGLHIRKSKIILSILQQVQERYGKWDLDHLFQLNDEDAMKELISYKGMGPKSAFVVMTWCLKRQNFTVDTHVYRIAGLWGWRPKEASVQQTQAHLDATIPPEFKFDLHFLILQHGRVCPACRGGSKGNQRCEAREEMQQDLWWK